MVRSWPCFEGRASRVCSLVLMDGLRERGTQNEAQTWGSDTRRAEDPFPEMGDIWEEWEGAHELASGPLKEVLNHHPRECTR